MIKKILLLCLTFSLSNCGGDKKIKGEKELLDVIGLNSLFYKIEMEYNELDKMREGIYLCTIILENKDVELVLHNIESNKIKNLSNEEYTFYPWKKGPIQGDYDSSFLNYNPIPNKVQKELSTLKHSLSSEDMYYAHFQNKENPFIGILYVFEVEQNKIMIYYTFF